MGERIIDWEGVRETVAYRCPIRTTSMVSGEAFPPIVTESPVQHVGCMASGGIDSTTVLTRLVKAGKKIDCFTLAWSSGAVDESGRASQVVEVIKEKYESIRHHVVRFDLEKYVKFYEEAARYGPHARPAYIPVMHAAKEKGLEVLYSGEGGDEVYAGYVNKYKKMLRIKRYSKFRFVAPIGSALPGKWGRYFWIMARSGTWSSYEAARTLTTDIYLPDRFRPYESSDWIASTVTLDYEVRLRHYIGMLNKMAAGVGITLVFPIMAEEFKPDRWRDYWRHDRYSKQPLVDELERFDPRLAEIATSQPHGFSPPPMVQMWNSGLGEMVLDELRDSPLRKVLGRKLNEVIDGDREGDEMLLTAAAEAYCMSRYFRERGLI